MSDDTYRMEWDKGTQNHTALCAYFSVLLFARVVFAWGDFHFCRAGVSYTIINYIGAVCCTILLYAIWKLGSKRSSTDILTVGLVLGCASMSFPCGTQCMLNLARNWGYWSWGAIACSLEAFFHVTAIQMQWFFVTLVAAHGYMAVKYQRALSTRNSYIAVVVTTLFSGVGTYVTSTQSMYFLMPAGAYCLFTPDSPIIRYWSVSLFVFVFCVLFWIIVCLLIFMCSVVYVAFVVFCCVVLCCFVCSACDLCV